MSFSVNKALRTAQSLLEAGKLDEAEQLYKKVLSKFPKNKKAIQGYQKLKTPPQAALDQVIGFYNQGQLKQAVSLAESLAWQYPKAPILYDILGAAYMGLKNAEKTIASYQKALELNPNHTDAHNNMGMALYDQGRFNEAVESYQKAVGLEPDFADAHYNLGNALKQVGDLKQAFESYKASLAINPSDAEVLINYGNALKEYGDFDQAIHYYENALRVDPNSGAVQTNIDDAVKEKAEIDKLVTDYARIVELEIGSAEIVSFTGNILNARGYVDAAIDSYKQAIKIKPDFAEAYVDLGIFLNDKGDLEAAIDSYKQAARIKPELVEAYFRMGNALQSKGDLDAAIVSYKKALTIRPDYAEVYSNMGNALLAKDNLDTAIDSYKQAVKVKPDFADAYYNMGIALQKTGDLDASVVSYKKALKINYDLTLAHAALGRVYHKQGRYRQAKPCFEMISGYDEAVPLLECLLHLGEYKELNDLLTSLAAQDCKDIKVAAISAFAATQLQQEDIYPFCKNAIEMVNIGHIGSHINSHKKFIKNLITEMNLKAATWEPGQKTTKSGFQTEGNLFDSNSPNIIRLKNIIEKEVNCYRDKFKLNTEYLITNWPQTTQITGWYVRMLQNGHQASHIHPAGWVSGVVYLKTIKDPIESEGAIELGLHGYGYPITNNKYPRTLYQPSEGDIILFPSSLFHKTIPVKKDVERCVIAFDLVPCLSPHESAKA